MHSTTPTSGGDAPEHAALTFSTTPPKPIPSRSSVVRLAWVKGGRGRHPLSLAEREQTQDLGSLRLAPMPARRCLRVLSNDRASDAVHAMCPSPTLIRPA